MISDLDRTLEKLFQLEFGTTLPFDLSFAIPDKEFAPISGTKNTLNCYLYDIRENRELRTVEPLFKRNIDGTVEKKRPPARIILSYCITAWSPAQITPGIVPVVDEHKLLSEVLEILLKYPTLSSEVLVGSLIGQEPPLPTTVVLPDGVKNISDFWNAIGGQLRPSLDYSVTISLDYQPKVTVPMVTTKISTYEQIPESASPDVSIQIGGQVTDNSLPPNLVADAWVLMEETGRTEISDKDGRFTFDYLKRGAYTLRVRAVGFHEASRNIQVPEPSGEYNIQLTRI